MLCVHVIARTLDNFNGAVVSILRLPNTPIPTTSMRNAFIALHVSILLAGWTGVFGKLIELTPFMIVFWRVVIGGSVLLGIVLAVKRLEKCSAKDITRFMLLGAFLAVQWMLFYAAIKASNVSIGVLSFSTVGFFTAIFEPLLERKRISLKEIGFSMLTVLGIALIFHFESRYRLRLFYGVLSAAGAALIAIFMKSFRRTHNPETVLTWQFAGAVLSFAAAAPFVFLTNPETRFWPVLWPDTLYLVIFATVITLGMYLLQMMALKHISAFTLNLSYNLEPVYSILIAMVLFDEARELNFSFWAGLALIALSVVLQTTSVLRQKKAAEGRPLA